jgi:hypothetical protein
MALFFEAATLARDITLMMSAGKRQKQPQHQRGFQLAHTHLSQFAQPVHWGDVDPKAFCAAGEESRLQT